MNQDIDVTSYVKEHAAGRGQKAEVCRHTLDALRRNGVATMRQLTEKSPLWLASLFVNAREGTDSAAYDLLMDVKNKYHAAVHQAELLASGEELVETYFSALTAETAPPHIISRAQSALCRGGLETMKALCAASPEELGRIRNVGAKCLALILRVRDEYIAKGA